MDFKLLLDTLARSSAQAVTTLHQGNEKERELKDYLYIETDIEKDFKDLLDGGLEAGSVLFLCGSSGDGKSELLKRYHRKYSESFRFHLDATHSFKPDQTAVQALDQLFDEHQRSPEPMIVGINVGMLFNYQSSGAERHAGIKNAIACFIEGENSSSNYQFVNFEDYPKFSLEEGAVGSKFVSELLRRVTSNDTENPLYRAYKMDPSKEVDLKFHNYRLLQEPAIQKVIVRALLHARLKFDQFFSARALLDFIHHLIAGDSVLFDNLFAAPGYGLANSLVGLDPCLLRSQKVDQFVVQYALCIADQDFEEFKEAYYKKYGYQELSPSSWIRAFYCLQEVELGNNYHEYFSKDFALPLFDEYIYAWQLHHSSGSKKQLREFYKKQLIESLMKFANRLESKIIDNGIFLEKINDIIVSAKVDVRADLTRIADANQKKHQIHCFHAVIKVDQIQLEPFPVTISFLELAQRILGGYRPNRHDKNAVVILEEVIEKLVSIANTTKSIHFHNQGKEWTLKLEDEEFVVEAG
ncbi:DNA phosphorothioation-dependent restriction protein DptF [Kushneria marisflavi]|uniref:DNA phosphorothioation-dependent restriction protein DptF n=1 Tax=Kushneria marisflavi TaxID=157779 RepID=A0A240UPT0_9GAMM|nr:DNA phosphorothioation-dependent restriction protein DptF [Kushneria marisflavi]ART63125.1 DNA phosphorothioation-dependent restriction protein DptF [Kushneria marisflavi]RKD84621.1 DNA phosphorothioation-dependent restriction protein DptF [Kushneria marisflavi]